MRRSLVLTDETSRHPFLAMLPPHVRKVEGMSEAETIWRLTNEDVRGFASVYLAAFAAILVFIA
ncbi:MAG: hypothetical protein ABJ239_04275 [Erythrobacter sp.]